MTRPLPCLALATLVSLSTPTPAAAAESYDSCAGFIGSLPATITTQGTWCLDQDLSTALSSGAAITIATNNVTIDCNHFKLGGLAAGAGTSTFGVFASTRLNATVRNCNIRGFARGVVFADGGGHLVEDSSFDGNTVYGVYLTSPGSTVRNNRVVDSGGSTVTTTFTVGIYAAFGVDVIDNTVNGVAPLGPTGDAWGILAEINGEGSISRNRVRGLAAVGTGFNFGISASSSSGSIIRDNDVRGPGIAVADSYGIRCGANTITARDNAVARFETGIEGCLLSSNIVNPN